MGLGSEAVNDFEIEDIAILEERSSSPDQNLFRRLYISEDVLSASA